MRESGLLSPSISFTHLPNQQTDAINKDLSGDCPVNDSDLPRLVVAGRRDDLEQLRPLLNLHQARGGERSSEQP